MDRNLSRVGLAVLAAWLAGCAPAEGFPERARGVTRQANSIGFDLDGGQLVLVKGTSVGAHLGAVLARCPAQGYVAGAPGDFTAWFSPAQQRIAVEHQLILPSGPPTFPVGCEGTSGGQTRGLVGGPDFATNLFLDGGASRLAAFRVDSFAVPLTASLPLAVANTSTGTVSFYPSSAQALVAMSNQAVAPQGTGFGASMVWNAATLVVGNPDQAEVGLISLALSDGGFTIGPTLLIADPDPMGPSDFGRVVASGNVTPHPGEELIVSAPAVGRVYLFSAGAPVMTLSSGVTFGASLAVDPRDLGGGLHALWVGEPGANTVHRFVGSADTTFTAPASLGNAQFGAALSVDSLGVTAVGAPDFTEGLLINAGVVVEGTIDSGVLTGLPMLCAAGLTCRLPNCALGHCLGEVFCVKQVPETSFCVSGQVCVTAQNSCLSTLTADGGVDAGGTVADAGADGGSRDAGRDAGGDLDAGGVADAGERPDAGAQPGVDGGADGALVFRTCGCTSGGLPALLLGLLLALRRRH